MYYSMPSDDNFLRSCKKTQTLREYHGLLSFLEKYPSVPSDFSARKEMIVSRYGPTIRDRSVESMSENQVYSISKSIDRCARKKIEEFGLENVIAQNINDVLRFGSLLNEAIRYGAVPPNRTKVVQAARLVPHTTPLRGIIMSMLKERRSYFPHELPKELPKEPSLEQESLF